jgi:hypothetical protein
MMAIDMTDELVPFLWAMIGLLVLSAAALVAAALPQLGARWNAPRRRRKKPHERTAAALLRDAMPPRA